MHIEEFIKNFPWHFVRLILGLRVKPSDYFLGATVFIKANVYSSTFKIDGEHCIIPRAIVWIANLNNQIIFDQLNGLFHSELFGQVLEVSFA